ncbi:MAG: preprotein translocase subunit SecG [Proteobacteria bacterium]|nr:preprotein translocase subunit SecG [Pseudomonadota bacterium]
MQTVLLVVHLILAIALVGVILVQRSEGGALGMGGGGMGGFMTGRATSDLLTRTTAILATCFIVTSILLAVLANAGRESKSILDKPATEQSQPAAIPNVPQVPAPAPKPN